MKHLNTLLPVFAILFVLISSFVGGLPRSPNATPRQEEQAVDPPVKVFAEPIAATEQELVIMMRRAFRPLFDSLKTEIGSDKKSTDVDFKNVVRDSLMMSELLARIHQWPDVGNFESAKDRANYAKTQKDLAIKETQSDAASIYKAANEKDYEAAQKSFVSMTNNCNICHQKMKSRWAPVVLKP